MTHVERLRLLADVIERHGIDNEQIVTCGTNCGPEILIRSLDYAESLTPMVQRWAEEGEASHFHFYGVLDGVEITALVPNRSEEAAPC